MTTNPACCLTTCYTSCIPVPSCIRFLKVATTVIDGSIAAQISDKFGHSYEFVATTGDDGVAMLDLDAAYLPEGLLNPFAGQFDLKVTDMKFPVDDVYYECLRFEVQKSYAMAGAEPIEGDLSTYPAYQLPYTYEPI